MLHRKINEAGSPLFLACLARINYHLFLFTSPLHSACSLQEKEERGSKKFEEKNLFFAG
jgi:hypothetical protein